MCYASLSSPLPALLQGGTMPSGRPEEAHGVWYAFQSTTAVRLLATAAGSALAAVGRPHLAPHLAYTAAVEQLDRFALTRWGDPYLELHHLPQPEGSLELPLQELYLSLAAALEGRVPELANFIILSE